MVTTIRYMFLYRSPTVAPRKAPSPAENGKGHGGIQGLEGEVPG